MTVLFDQDPLLANDSFLKFLLPVYLGVNYILFPAQSLLIISSSQYHTTFKNGSISQMNVKLDTVNFVCLYFLKYLQVF